MLDNRNAALILIFLRVPHYRAGGTGLGRELVLDSVCSIQGNVGSVPDSPHLHTVVNNEAPEAIMQIAHAWRLALCLMWGGCLWAAPTLGVCPIVNCGYGGGSYVQMHLC